MLYAIWLIFSLIVFFLYPLFFSRREMYGLSVATFFIKRLVSSLFIGGAILFLLALVVQGGA